LCSLSERMVEVGVGVGVGESLEENGILDLGEEGMFVENQTVPAGEELQVIPSPAWWWAGWSLLSFVGLVLNLLFLVVVIKGRKDRDLRSLLTAVLITISVLDIFDIFRIIPSIVINVHQFPEFRITFCSLGIFHSLCISLLLTLLGLFLVCPCRDAPPIYYPNSKCSGSLPQKILIPVFILISGGAAAVVYIFPRIHGNVVNGDGMVPHSCIDHTSLVYLIQSEEGSQSETFWSDIYQVCISLLSLLLPLLVIPFTIIISCCQAAFRGLCCQAKYKQPAGEVLVVLLLLLSYLGTTTGSLLPHLAPWLSFSVAPLAPTTVLWELANASLRPIIYFLCNPAVWEALKNTCCSTKRSYSSVSTREDKEALAPVVERVSSL